MAAKPKYNLIPCFQQWLKETSNCSGRVLSAVKEKKCLNVKLQGITDLIHFTVLPAGLNISVYFHGECYDFLRSMDIDVRINKEGRYYCAQCSSDQPDYDTEYELCVEHTFKPAIEYIESIARPEKVLILRYKANHWSDAVVIDKDLLHTVDKENITAERNVMNTDTCESDSLSE